jgi:Glyoxalase-like domain
MAVAAAAISTIPRIQAQYTLAGGGWLLLSLGARRVDIGQTGAESWTVLADPEGNEFCVVRPKQTLTR